MSKNLIPEIAKMLGVGIGEEFKLAGSETIYCFTEGHLKYCYKSSYYEVWNTICEGVFVRLLEGRDEIIKLPWHPQCGDTYWTYSGDDFDTFLYKWAGVANDYARLKCGCVFRTREEALKAKPRLYKELTGKDWGGKT